MALFTHTVGSGPDLFLVHGWGMNSAVWEGFAAALSGDFRVTAVDLPGHGFSAPRGVFSLSDAVDAALEVAPAHGVWLGWSLGGMVALEAAACFPKRVRALVLMASSPRFVAAPAWPGMDASVLEQFAADLAADSRGTLLRFLALVARGAEPESDTLRVLRRRFAVAPPPDPSALQAGLDILRYADLRPRLGDLVVPAMAVFGERDMLVPSSVAPLLSEALFRGRVVTVPGAGHAPFLSHPARCAGLLRAFIQ